MDDASRYERIVVDRYRYRGFHGCQSWCALEISVVADKRIVIATELEDNPGTSITNIGGELISWVCEDFKLDPYYVVWIEHYRYPSPVNRELPRTYDLVTFDLFRMGHMILLTHCRWRPMTDEDWRNLGLEPRPPGP